MKMQGGGTWSGISPGQITDDSELAISLADGLIEGNGVLNLDLIAKSYAEWIKSSPFDIGMTTSSAFSRMANIYQKMTQEERILGKGLAEITYKSVRQANEGSQSNGGVMRITPMALFCLNLSSEEEILKAVSAEAHLSHCNKTNVEATFYWVLALVKLLKRKDDECMII
jgi:ADP-ribosyl-[dinitrogen reductase] hydrolase